MRLPLVHDRVGLDDDRSLVDLDGGPARLGVDLGLGALVAEAVGRRPGGVDAEGVLGDEAAVGAVEPDRVRGRPGAGRPWWRCRA